MALIGVVLLAIKLGLALFIVVPAVLAFVGLSGLGWLSLRVRDPTVRAVILALCVIGFGATVTWSVDNDVVEFAQWAATWP